MIPAYFKERDFLFKMPAEFIRPTQAITYINGAGAPDDKDWKVYRSIPHPNDPEDGIVLKINASRPPTRLEERINGFQVPAEASKILARSYYEVYRAQIPATRASNEGQFGGTAGSTYIIPDLGIVTSNRADGLNNQESSGVVPKTILIPVILMMDREGELIKFLPSSRVVLSGDNKPINDFFKPEEILTAEEWRVYNRYHKTTERIDDVRIIMILAQAQNTLAQFHKAYLL